MSRVATMMCRICIAGCVGERGRGGRGGCDAGSHRGGGRVKMACGSWQTAYPPGRSGLYLRFMLGFETRGPVWKCKLAPPTLLEYPESSTRHPTLWPSSSSAIACCSQEGRGQEGWDQRQHEGQTPQGEPGSRRRPRCSVSLTANKPPFCTILFEAPNKHEIKSKRAAGRGAGGALLRPRARGLFAVVVGRGLRH